ncbi:4309_t:CDS:2, partial [Gigaspora rosea]
SCLGELYVAVVVQNPEIGVLYPFSSFRAIHRCPFGIVPWRTLRCRRRSGGSESWNRRVITFFFFSCNFVVGPFGIAP